MTEKQLGTDQDGSMDAHRTTVGLMADPGVPATAAAAIADGLRREPGQGHDDVGWYVECSTESLPLAPDGNVVLLDKASELRRRYGWDHLVYLTDLPRYHGKDPLLCEVSHDDRAALVSMPTLGAARLHPQVEKLVAALVHSAEEGATQSSLVESIRSTSGFTRARGAEGHDDLAHVVLTGWSSRLRLLTGMVRSNRPGRMLPALSGSLTAAAAAGAFGVYYSSIWTLADALHPARLLLVGAIVVALLTGWLIVRNGLWNIRHEVESPWQGLLDNTTTVIMVGTSVLLMYLLLAVGLFGLSLVVVDDGLLRSELKHPVNLVDYVRLSWIAASLGMLFGALGSNFDTEDDVREATYSQRESERRQRRDAAEGSGGARG